MSQSTIDLILRVGGQDALDHLAKSTANYRGLIEELAAKFARGDINADEYQKRLAKLSGELEKQDRLFKQLTQSQSQSYQGQAAGMAAVEKSTAAVGHAAGASGERMRGFSYAMNDFFSVTGGLDQRLNAIANNLPMLLAGFGGLGLALSGIVPIIAMVYRNWDTLTAFLGTASDFAKSRIEALQKTIADLEAKPVKLAIDLTNLREAKKELADLEAGQQAFEAWAKSRVKPQEESGAKFKEILGGEPGGAKISAALEKRMAESAVAFDPEIKKSRREANDARLAYERAEKDAAKEEGLLGKLPYLAEASSGRAAEKAALARASTRAQLVRDQATREAGGVYKSATEGDPAAQARMIGELEHAHGGMDAVVGQLKGATAPAIKASEKAQATAKSDVVQKTIIPFVDKVTKHFADLRKLGAIMEEIAKHTEPGERATEADNVAVGEQLAKARDLLGGDRATTINPPRPEAAGGGVKTPAGTGKFGKVAAEIAAANPDFDVSMLGKVGAGMDYDASRTAQGVERGKQPAEARRAAHDAELAKAQDLTRGEREAKTTTDVQASLAGSSIDERAAVEAAKMAAFGGAVNPATGGVHKLDESGQFDRLAGMIGREIAAANPGLDPSMLDKLAGGMAEKATRDAQAVFRGKRAEVADAVGTQAAQTGQTVPQLLGVNSQTQANQAITNEAIRQTLVAVNNLQQQALQNGAQIQALGRVAGATAAETTARTRSPQRVGQP